MDVKFTQEDLVFRDEVRAFFEEEYDFDLAKQVFNDKSDDYKSAIVAWQKKLHKKGWIAPAWPTEYGGSGWTITQRYIFESERGRLGIPDAVPFGLKMVGPVIYTFGNQQQKERFLPRILSSDDWWCQGYSEPGAGSDLASLQTSAELVGENYIVNGQKV